MSDVNPARKSRHENHTNHTSAPHETADHAPAPAPAPATIEPVAIVRAPSTVRINGRDVSVMALFAAGMPMDANQAAILNADHERQFSNNMTAEAKTRAENYAKATTDAERGKYAPLTDEEYAEKYRTYVHLYNARGARAPAEERFRLEACWRAWVVVATEHNNAVRAWLALGDETADFVPVITRAGKGFVTIQTPPRKAKGASEAEHNVAITKFNDAKALFLEKFAAAPDNAERIQTQLDAILAENAAKKAKDEIETKAPTVDMGSLY